MFNNFIEILLAEKIQDDKLCFLVIEDKLIWLYVIYKIIFILYTYDLFKSYLNFKSI